MRPMRGRVWAVIATLVLAIARVGANEREQIIVFDAGASSIALQQQISGHGSVHYALDITEQQVLSIHLAPLHGDCHLNVWSPGADEVTHRGVEQGKAFVANVARVGRYRAQVYLLPGAAEIAATCAYEITFHRTRAGAALPLPTVPQGRDALRAGIERCVDMVGGPAEIIAAKPRGPGLFALELRARDGTQRSVCVVREDGTLEDWIER